MSRHHATDVQESAPSPPLPADHVLWSGAVLFPGAFDQHGCPLIMFPVDGQDKLSSELSKSQVVDFINYFLRLHNHSKLLSVVADLRQASPATTRFIADTLLLLELHKRTVHSVYVIQPKKKDVVKLLLKHLVPPKPHTASFKKVLLKEISELSNHIDRSQLPAELGGYLIYRHQSWVAFIKEIDAFVQEFLCVVQRLPECISSLRALSRLPMPSAFTELQHFCSNNQATFQQLRRELGLDELLRHCECVLEKLRSPETEPCYLDMAGTALYTRTSHDMMHNHGRITSAVEKVELLWQRAFSTAHLQLQVLQLREDALQITEQIKTLFQEKLEPYQMEIAKDDAKAVMLESEFEASIYTPAMALVRCAEDVIHMSVEMLPYDAHTGEHWALDLERLKDKLHSAVHFILQTLGAVSNYHHFYNKASGWYTLALFENFLQELLSGLNAESTQRRSGGAAPAWKHKISTFLKKNPPPDTEELVHLVNLSSAIPVEEVQQAGTQMAQRCMTLRKLLVSSGPVAVAELQLALQWQYQFFRSSNGNASPAGSATDTKAEDVPEHSSKHKSRKQDAAHPRPTSTTAACGMLSAEGKPISLSSFDSGFDGAGTSPLEAWAGRDKVDGLSRLAENKDSVGPDLSQPQTHKDNISTLFDCEDHREEFGFLGDSSRASVHTLPKPTAQPISFDVQVKRSAALPTNPWLSLPVDDLENSYKVTVTQNPTLQKRDPQFHDPLDPYGNAEKFDRCGDEPRQTSVLSSPQARELQTRDWLLHSHCTLEDSELSPTDNMLSSTLTDGRDKSVCATEDDPSLLWDSYDLRDHNQDPVHGLIDISMDDWDLKEQEGLREVEKVLERADEILEKEEDVVAQEAVLEALLCSEDRLHQWPQWDSEQQHTGMSSSELAEAGVLGLDDNLVPAESDDLSEPRSTGSPIETEFWEWDNPSTEATPEAEDTVSFPSRPGLVTELREVQVLDQLIMEENLKIHDLRRCVEESPNEDHLSRGKALDPNGLLKMSKERQAFRVQLEKEKREVKKLEKSLDKEHDKKHKNRARKVVKCSIMEKTSTKNEEVPAQSVAIVSGSCNESQTTNSYAEGICETKRIQAVWGPNVAQEATTQQDLIQLPDSQCLQDHCSEARPTVFNRTTLISASDFTEALGGKEKVTEPQGYIYGRELDGSGGEKNATICKPEASLSPETRLDDGAFDPGGESLQVPPQPKPRKALFLLNKIVSKQETPHSEQQNPALSPQPTFVQFDLQNEPSSELPENLTPAISTNLDLNPNANEHSTNNNNNYALSELSLSESSSTEEEDTWVAPAFLRQAHSPPPEEIQADMRANEGQDPLPTPELPPEFGRDEQNEEDWSDGGVHSSLAMRRSGSGAHGPQAQLNNNTREVTDFKTPIVLDTGSGLMKAGFADQDLPNIIYPTIIGMPKYEEVMKGCFERETYIGHEAQHMRGVLALKRPIKNGIIRNWDEMEKIWTHTFQQLRVEPEDHPVLLTEAAMNPLDNRRRTVEIMFECFNVPFTYVAMQAVLALYASGRVTGVVFDSGDGVSHSVPVFEGYSLPHAVQRFPLAGVDVTMHLKKLLQESGVSMRTTAELEIVREMKEQCCCVALDYEAELSGGGAATREMYYTMPDGQIVNLHTERFRAPEILFKPELIGRDHYGMHKCLLKSILCSDIDLRGCLLGNIVLSGGNTQLAGLPERLQDEMVGLAGEMGESVRVSRPQHRDFSVWRGGAALANLPSFSSAWISQEEYDEIGSEIVFRKCF